MLIKSLPNRKAPGPDSITAEMLKYGGGPATKMMKRLLNTIMHCDTIPTNMNLAKIVLLPKDNEHRQDPALRRPISLMNTSLKLLDKKLKGLLGEHIEQQDLLSKEQAGFRPGLSCMHHILTMSRFASYKQPRTRWYMLSSSTSRRPSIQWIGDN